MSSQSPDRGATADAKKPSPRGRWRRVFLALWGLGPILGSASALYTIETHGYRERDLPGLVAWVWREGVAEGLRTAFWGALTVAVFAWFSGRIEPDRRRRQRALLLTPFLATAFAAGALFGGAWWFRPELGGALAEDINIWLVVGNAVLPALADETRVPRALLAVAAAIFLLVAFLVSRLVFRRAGEKFAIGPVGRALRWCARLGGAGVAIGIFVSTSPPRETMPDRPDIVLISIDTLRADHLSIYGYERDTAPRLAKLAREGIVADRFISHAPWTLPTHMSIFTGRRPWEHGVTSIELVLDAGTTTLGEILKDAGYATGAVATNYLLSPAFGFARGFDRYQLRPDFRASTVADFAADWWKRADGPRFLFLHLYDPHYPYAPPDDSAGTFGPVVHRVDDLQGLAFLDFAREAAGFSATERQAVIDRYDEEILGADAAISKLLTTLDADGERKPWIIVTSDHGEEFADHGMWGHSVTLYEEMIRVPLIVRAPDAACAGLRDAGLIEQRRLFDLIAAIGTRDASDPAMRCADGRSPELLRGLAGPVAIAESEVFGPHRFAVRTETKKRIEPICFDLDAFTVEHPVEFYDLESDPAERDNLFPEFDDENLRARLERENLDRLQRLEESSGATRDVSDLERERLRSLGYLQ
ncbi:MAG: sulfatase [Deltaproteobacteria bacterium]|nr:sulfatase [Deltaproteobacteria bacterium]